MRGLSVRLHTNEECRFMFGRIVEFRKHLNRSREAFESFSSSVHSTESKHSSVTLSPFSKTGDGGTARVNSRHGVVYTLWSMERGAGS